MSEDLKPIVAKIVGTVLADLKGRSGISHEWDAIDDDIKTEIIAEWHSLVDVALSCDTRTPAPSLEHVDCIHYREISTCPECGPRYKARLASRTTETIPREWWERLRGMLDISLDNEYLGGSHPEFAEALKQVSRQMDAIERGK